MKERDVLKANTKNQINSFHQNILLRLRPKYCSNKKTVTTVTDGLSEGQTKSMDSLAPNNLRTCARNF